MNKCTCECNKYKINRTFEWCKPSFMDQDVIRVTLRGNGEIDFLMSTDRGVAYTKLDKDELTEIKNKIEEILR